MYTRKCTLSQIQISLYKIEQIKRFKKEGQKKIMNSSHTVKQKLTTVRDNASIIKVIFDEEDN